MPTSSKKPAKKAASALPKPNKISTSSKVAAKAAKPKGIIASPKKRFSLSPKQWALAGVAGFIVLTGAVYFLVQSQEQTTADAASCVSKVYKQGSSSTCVKYAQILLNYKIKNNAPKTSKVAEDGAFGAKTKTAVKAFQKYWGLGSDGVIGKQTWSSLCSSGMGYTDSKGVGHATWKDTKSANAAKSAGCK